MRLILPMKNVPNKKNVVKYMTKELSNPTVNNGQNGYFRKDIGFKIFE